MSELFNKKEVLKNLIKQLHENPNENFGKIQEQFKHLIRELTPIEISQVEQELINEGTPAETIQLMCDVHLDLFKEALIEDKLDVEPWHPIHILMEEHKDILNKTKALRELTNKIVNSELDEFNSKEFLKELKEFADYLSEIEKYFHKEEDVLFPYLEKHGVVQPPAIMWKEHDDIRALIKEFKKLLNSPLNEVKMKIKEVALGISELFYNHIYKEHKVLFPTALKLITDTEWKEIRKQFEELGYFAYKPIPFFLQDESQESTVDNKDGLLNLGSGYLSVEQLIAMLNTLPIDITFVDDTDTVRYFNESPDRIFIRTRAIIGRKVQNCHPQKSVHVVNKILNDFKSGKRDSADFWLKLGDKYVYIRYLAVRNEKGEYLGTLEITQDIAPIQKITGEKRIYDDLES
ncbi:MAG: uncharacterized protein PWQ27_1414 [Kosmotoga sp.]|nr:uncharacterized protein [Kosmotoga sp.]